MSTTHLGLATPHALSPALWNGIRRWIERVQRVRSHQKYFFAVAETVTVGIWVEGVGSDGLLFHVE